jgi:hypothetical protein
MVPGNVVMLCHACNSWKSDTPPEDFYSAGELERLAVKLAQQREVLDSKWSWWNLADDRGPYFLSLGVSPLLLEEMSTNPYHPYYRHAEQPGLIISAQPE